MSMQVYQNRANEAVMAFHSRNYRAAAIKYLESFEASPGKWTENRWHIFHGFTSILQEEYFQASQSDMEALERIASDRTEPKLYRCEAAFTAGLLSWIAKDREKAAEFYREVTRLADKIKDSERKKKVLASLTTPDGNAITGIGPKRVDEIILDIRTRASDNLMRLESTNLQGFPPPSQGKMRSDGTQLPPAKRNTKISIGPLATTFTQKQAGYMLSVGGETCDCCKKTREELGLKHHLQSCSRCKKAFYCSKDCQAKQWAAGHKRYCRKPGEIKPGDFVRLNGIRSQPEINGELVEVIGPDRNSMGRWEVRIPGGNRSISVAGEKMEHLRPLK